MAKKQNNGKTERAEKMKRTDILYYRMIAVLVALVCVTFCMTGLTRTADLKNRFTLTVAPIISLVFAVLFVASVVYFAVCRAKKLDETYVVFSSGFLSTVSLWLTAVFGLYGRIGEKKLIVFIIVTAALYFIFYLYAREFFMFSLVSALGAALFAEMYSALRLEHIIFALLSLAVGVLCVLLAVSGQKRPVKIRNFVLFDKSMKIYPFCISSGIIIAGTVSSFIFSGGAFYSLIVLFAFYLVYTVVSTVKMM